MSRPARDDHLAGGITKRALNHWCFCNSKTLFRRIRVEPRFAEHLPVVVHANYHQPKPPRMAAVYDRWHLKQPDALNRFPGEQAFTVPAPELERDFLHMINDGFVSGANTRDASQALVKSGCAPQKSKHGLSIQLHTRSRTPCAAGDALCAAAALVAREGPAGGIPELVVVSGGEAEAEEMRLLLQSTKRTGIKALLLVLTSQAAATALGADLPPPAAGSGADATEAAGGGPRSIVLGSDAPAHPLGQRIGKFELVGRLLSQGFGVLYAAPPTLFLRDPFASLYRDADIEAMTLGWDDGSAYGYNHVLDVRSAARPLPPPFSLTPSPLRLVASLSPLLAPTAPGCWWRPRSFLPPCRHPHTTPRGSQDPSMGFTRFCHGSRIVGYNPGFFFAMPTGEAIALTARMAERLRRAEALDGKLSPSSSAFAVAEVERIEFVHELWLPSHHDYASVGAVLRVMNYLCFVNSKVLFRQLRNQPASASSGTPVALQIDYHSDTLPRMRASLARYLDGRGEDLRALPLSDASDAKAGAEAGPLGCSRSGATGSSASKIGAHLIAHSPYAWGGVGDMIFQEEGVLETPWGKGEWGLHPSDGAGTAVYADFVGAKHNVRFELSSGMGVSTRCTDNNVVLVRSIKAAKAKAK